MKNENLFCFYFFICFCFFLLFLSIFVSCGFLCLTLFFFEWNMFDGMNSIKWTGAGDLHSIHVCRHLYFFWTLLVIPSKMILRIRLFTSSFYWCCLLVILQQHLFQKFSIYSCLNNLLWFLNFSCYLHFIPGRRKMLRLPKALLIVSNKKEIKLILPKFRRYKH